MKLGFELGRSFEGGEVLFLEGPLGSGKTTLVKGLAKGLGVVRDVTSPSFVLEKTYTGRTTLRHVDLYRLDPGEAAEFWHSLEAGPEEVLAVEWGERIAELVPGGIRVDMEYCEDPNARKVTISWETPSQGQTIRKAVERWREEKSR
ncbi:MAG: tRNA (adenosine(37)-N6)-threonylcarbamoyltransferase complex ATPase subunit type 1 TsaE [Firmicutes bacterium]|nr:tRNA (adenosine(37)-N6)-threonylcarbamoyltransferase complex ATPase subunit type 1 TsaE [Candidatus Fermentithermobacillaceae bacterium]